MSVGHPVNLDWTEKAKEDLSELGLPASLEYLQSQSKNSFQKIVRENIKKFEFSKLMEGRKSKLMNLNYCKLEMQEYLHLKNMNKKQAIVLFKFRTRMAPFGENFRAGNVATICPLCSSHIDSQEESFNCEALRKVLTVKGRYSTIFGTVFTKELIQTLFDIFCFREEFRK